MLGNKWNYINQEGDYLTNQWYDWAEPFSEGLAWVKLNGKWYIIYTDGNFKREIMDL